MRPEDAQLQVAALPAARRVTLPGGHHLHYDAPAELAEIIAETATRIQAVVGQAASGRDFL
jgi:pimeloyl-ACP methyl ester carboxylesterase